MNRADALCLAILVLVPAIIYTARAIAGSGLLYGDALTQHVPSWAYTADEFRQLRIPFWNPFTYNGQPHAADSIPAVFFPPNLIFLVLPMAVAAHLASVAPTSISAAWLYFHLRDRAVSRSSAVLAGLIVGLSAALLSQLYHVGIATIAALFVVQMMLADRWIRTGRAGAYRWLIAVGVLQCLAGHPQVLVYAFISTGVWAGAIGLVEARTRAAWTRVVAVAPAHAIALGLSAFFLIPAAEMAGQSVRSAVSYRFFAEGSLPPVFLGMLVAPWLFGDGLPPVNGPPWGPLEQWWEAIQYLGVVAVPLIAIALGRWRSDRRVRVYAVAGLALLVLALGGYTILHPLLFHLPFYQSFRFSGRYLLFWAPIAAALAAIGLDAIRAGRPSPGAILRWGAGSLIGLVAAALLLHWLGNAAELAALLERVRAGRVAIAPAALIWPAAVLALSLALLAAIARARTRRAGRFALAALTALTVADLAGVIWVYPGFAYAAWDVTLAMRAACGGELPRPAGPERPDRIAYTEFIGPSIAAAETCGPNWPMIDRQATSNGYDSLVQRRNLELLNADGWGTTVRTDAVVRHAPQVDLYGIRYLLAQAYPPGPTIHDGIAFAQRGLGIGLGPGETVRFDFGLTPVPEAVRPRRIGLLSSLGGAADLPAGAPVAEIRVTAEDGSVRTLPVRAGLETAEAAWDDPARAGRIAHPRPPIAASSTDPTGGFLVHTYLARIDLGGEVRPRALEIRSVAERAGLALAGLALHDPASGRSMPIGVAPLLVASPHYRNPTRRDDLIVVENPTAFPRAWSVADVRPLPAEAIRSAILTGRLPGGQAFDPARAALAEADPAAPARRFTPARVAATGFAPGRIDLRVRAPGDAFVVIAESSYPGWRATVDGHETPIERVNHVQMGVAVPPGDHAVTVWYDPRVFLAGLAVSLATLALVLATTGRARRTPGRRARVAAGPPGDESGSRAADT